MKNDFYYKSVICQEKAFVGSSNEKSWSKLAHLYVFIINNGVVWVSRLKASGMLCHFSQDSARSNFHQHHCENRKPCIFWVCKNFFLTALDMNKKNYVLLFLCHDFMDTSTTLSCERKMSWQRKITE